MVLAIIGIALSIFGSSLAALGWVFQKLAHNKCGEKDKYWKQPHWWIGFAMVLISQPLYLAAAGMANQSTLGAIEPVPILANAVFAWIILGEKLTKLKMGAIGLFVPGIILTLLFASMETNRMNRNEFTDVFFGKLSMYYCAFTLALIIIGMTLSNIIVHVHPKEEYEEFEDENDDEGSKIQNAF